MKILKVLMILMIWALIIVGIIAKSITYSRTGNYELEVEVCGTDEQIIDMTIAPCTCIMQTTMQTTAQTIQEQSTTIAHTMRQQTTRRHSDDDSLENNRDISSVNIYIGLILWLIVVIIPLVV